MNFFSTYSTLICRSPSFELMTTALWNCEKGIPPKVCVVWSDLRFRYLLESVGLMNTEVSSLQLSRDGVMSKKSTFFPTSPFKVNLFAHPTVLSALLKASNCLSDPFQRNHKSSRNLSLFSTLFFGAMVGRGSSFLSTILRFTIFTISKFIIHYKNNIN